MDQRAIIYQLAVRYFGNTNTTNAWAGEMAVNGCGKFNDINAAAIAGLKELGATHLWLTGCLRQATLTTYPQKGLEADDPDIVKGRAGSFYAVRDYFDVCPDYATDASTRMQEFEALIGRVHDAGLKVLIDFVPNHVARSYGSIIRPDMNFGTGDDQSVFFSPNNCFFYLVDPAGQQLRLSHPEGWAPIGVEMDGRFEAEDGTAGRVPKATANAWRFDTTASPSASDWYEAVKLNYGYNYVTGEGKYDTRPRTWTIMDEVLSFWQSKGVDGFRCDMAHLIPREAWRYLIGNARKETRNPDTYFLAEAYVGTSLGDPIESNAELLDAGFDAVYHDESYNRLRDLYRGGTQDAYDEEMRKLPAREREAAAEYLENHDKPRVAAINGEGFGGMNANRQLAPLQFLYGSGPVLLLNGQEVGEPAAGAEGFSGDDGRTTFFDYWCMPEFAKWVNGHLYDGGRLSEEQGSLRQFLANLLRLCQHPCARGDGYWGLKYFNRSSQFADCPDALYTFARFASRGGQMLLVVANFNLNGDVEGRIRIPAELRFAAQLSQQVSVRMILDRSGGQNNLAAEMTAEDLATRGIAVALQNQETQVFEIR